MLNGRIRDGSHARSIAPAWAAGSDECPSAEMIGKVRIGTTLNKTNPQSTASKQPDMNVPARSSQATTTGCSMRQVGIARACSCTQLIGTSNPLLLHPEILALWVIVHPTYDTSKAARSIEKDIRSGKYPTQNRKYQLQMKHHFR